MIKKNNTANCETCAYYDYDEYTESYACTVNLDEDEYARYTTSNNKDCPYYKFYDEYKMVQKQN